RTLSPRSTLFPYTTLFRSWSSNGVSESGSATHNESTEYVSFALRFQVNHLDGDEADMEPMDVQAEAIAGGSFSLVADEAASGDGDRKSTRLNSSHEWISYA